MKANYGTLAAIWKVDPSGYVYDARTGERLEGFKTAAYRIEYVGDDTLWDASERDQVSPMLTDEQGKYA